MIANDIASASGAVSFRDPAGKVYREGGRVLRAVNSSGVGDLEAFLFSSAAGRLMAEGKIVGTRRLSPPETLNYPCDVLLEHDRVEFPSFPYEWPPEMLHEAASLTLELALRLQSGGLGLKDATPYNVLYRGTQPVFVDILSFERRQPGDASWLPYAQFIRTFLLPLLASQHFGMAPHQFFLTRRDGLEPEELYRWAGPLRRLRPSFLNLVTLPVWLGTRSQGSAQSLYRRTLMPDAAKAAFVFRSLLSGLQRTLHKLEPARGTHSRWSDYLTSNNNYSAEHFETKRDFVGQALAEFRPRRVLDVGCNTGFFSAMAARTGARVVAIDYDPVVVGETWRSSREHGLDVLPLVVDLARPTPGVGWRNSECASFLQRSRGAFDAVLMLAVIHHMLVTERIPLPEIVDMAAELTTDLLIVEFVAPQDSMFARLVRGRGELHAGLNTAAFEACFRKRFDIVSVRHLEGTHRWLYTLRARVKTSS